jgi:peptidoglycan/LPS O-acetylase OafA/YrhL
LKYVKGLDTIRALAIFFVIVDKYHWGPDFKAYPFLASLKEACIPDGRFGVNLFFVLSGFLITSILLQEKIHRSDGGANNFGIIKTFYLRRIFRIFPIYHLTILVCCLLGSTYVIDHLLYFVTYTSNMIPNVTENNPLLHTWSLAVEEQFYIIWPFLIIFVSRKYLKHVFIGAIIVGILSKYIEAYVFHSGLFSVFSAFDSFGIGGLYAYMKMDESTHTKFKSYFSIALPIMLFIAWRLAPINGLPICVIYDKVLDNLVALFIIMLAMYNRSEWWRKYFFENKALNFIGKISYGIYLYHFLLGPGYDNVVAGLSAKHTLPSVLTNFYSAYCIKLTLLIALCWVSFKVVEEPIINLKKRFKYTHKNTNAA